MQFSCNNRWDFQKCPCNSHLQFSSNSHLTILIQFSPDNSHPILTWQFSSNSHLTTLIQFSPDNSHPILTWQFSSNSHLTILIQFSSDNSHPILTWQFSSNFHLTIPIQFSPYNYQPILTNNAQPIFSCKIMQPILDLISHLFFLNAVLIIDQN